MAVLSETVSKRKCEHSVWHKCNASLNSVRSAYGSPQKKQSRTRSRQQASMSGEAKRRRKAGRPPGTFSKLVAARFFPAVQSTSNSCSVDVVLMILCHVIGLPVANGNSVKVDSDCLKVVERVENVHNCLGQTEYIPRISTIRDEIFSCLHKTDGDLVKQNGGSWTVRRRYILEPC